MKKYLFWVFCVALCLSSCNRKEELSFALPNDDPLAYVPGTLWAVVTEPLAIFRESDSYESPALQPARRGDVFAVTGKRISSHQEENGTALTMVWYCFDDGWLEESSIAIYDNETQALTAGKRLREH